jgi:hypothetical protein
LACPDRGGPLSGPTGSVPHLVLGDLAVLGLVISQEVVNGLQSPGRRGTGQELLAEDVQVTLEGVVAKQLGIG